MGDRYQWMDKCPNCGHSISCFYADSCGVKDVKCSKCHVEYEIILSFELREKKPEELPRKRGLTVDEIISKYPESVRILLGELLLEIENLQKPEIRIRPRFSKRTEITEEFIETKAREFFGWAADPHTIKEIRDYVRSFVDEVPVKKVAVTEGFVEKWNQVIAERVNVKMKKDFIREEISLVYPGTENLAQMLAEAGVEIRETQKNVKK